MTSTERRMTIITDLRDTDEPITGGDIAQKFGVTRQIIVKDIGLLKAQGYDIVSTAKGYCLKKEPEPWKCRIVTVCHSTEDIERELQIIVDLGGHALRTEVNHPAYGLVGEKLNVKSRKDVQLFLQKIKAGDCEPLLFLTKGVHTHLIEAEDEKTLDEICSALNDAGYLH